MAHKILTVLQETFLQLVARNKPIAQHFYLTGGTALAAFYLNHRRSEDLDFFSAQEIDLLGINAFLKDCRIKLGLKKIDYEKSFNRNIYFLHTRHAVLKTEFTYFPFEQIKKPALRSGVPVDSVDDIAVNKLFAIYQNPRARDYIDLFHIMKSYKTLSLPKLSQMARVKFDTHIDPLQLGTQLLKAEEAADLPRMLVKLDHRTWRSFFRTQAAALSKQIFNS